MSSLFTYIKGWRGLKEILKNVQIVNETSQNNQNLHVTAGQK